MIDPGRKPTDAPPTPPVAGRRRRGLGIRARIVFSLAVAAAAMIPVVAVSLYHIREVTLALEHAETQALAVQQAVDALPALVASEPEPEVLQSRIRSFDDLIARMRETRQEALRALSEAQRNVLTVLLLTLVVTALLLVYLPKTIMAPVQRILNVVRRAEHGDYDAELPLRGADEVGQIALALRRLLERLRNEREETRRIQQDVRRDLALVGHGLPEPVCVVDRDLTVGWANHAFRHMVGADDAILGRPLEQWIPDEALLSHVRHAFSGGSEEQVIRFVDHRGERHKQRVAISTGHADTGELDRIGVVFGKAGLLG